MCVKKVQAWDHAGKLFATEEDALKAALKDIADLLMKDHSAKLHDGLLAVSQKLRSVLDRLAAIEKLKPVAAAPADRFVNGAVAETGRPPLGTGTTRRLTTPAPAALPAAGN